MTDDPPDEVARDSVRRRVCLDPDKMLGALDGGWEQGVSAERARCRAIVLKHFGNEWRGNAALAEIDGDAL